MGDAKSVSIFEYRELSGFSCFAERAKELVRENTGISIVEKGRRERPANLPVNQTSRACCGGSRETGE
jgi:hypothetical protein